MTTTDTKLAQDARTIEAYARWLGHARWGCAEVRVLKAPALRPGRGSFLNPGTHAGYFADPARIAPAVRPWGSGHADCGVYVSANPYGADLLARSDHRLKHAGKSAGDCGTIGDVARLVHLPLDFDPVRPTGIPATDDELAAAIAARDLARERLDELGVSGASGVSGNGCYLLLPTLGYENTEENRARWGRLLDGFVRAFSTPTVKLDEKLKDPSRVIRLLGTVNAKGDGSAERPWRLSTFDEPGEFEPAELLERADELLAALGAPAPTVVEVQRPRPPAPPAPPPPPAAAARNGSGRPGYDEHWQAIGPRLVELVPELEPRVAPSGERVELSCPMCGREAWVGLRVGTPWLRCKHEGSCKHAERLTEYLKRQRGLTGDREVLELLASVSGLAAPAPPRRESESYNRGAASAREDARLRRARVAIYDLPESVEAWQWVGFQAERRGAGDVARELVPEAYRDEYERGRRVVRDGGRPITRPPRTSDAQKKAAERALDGLVLQDDASGEKKDLGDLEVLRLVHHERPQSRGGEYDLELRYRGKTATVRGLSGRELGSYSLTRGRTLEVRLPLPTPFKGANDLWSNMVDEAINDDEVLEVVAVPDVAVPEVHAERVIAEFLRSADQGETADELDRGAVLEDEARPTDGMPPRVRRVLLVLPRAVLNAVKKGMPDDGLKRPEVIAAAGRVGGVFVRSRHLRTGERRAVLVFPTELLDEREGGA